MQILQFSTAVPKNKYSTRELMQLFPCELSEGLRQNVLNLGVETRHLISHNYSTSKNENLMKEDELADLFREACEKAMEKADLKLEDINYFIMTYDARPVLCPSLNQILIRKLGFSSDIKHVNVQGMACSALAKALELAENYLAIHKEDFVLVCISGVNSYWFHNQVKGFNDVMEINRINSLRDAEERALELRKWIATMEYFLFGDGVAGVVLANDGGGLSVKKIVEVTNIDFEDVSAGYARLAVLNEPFKFGFYSHLGKEIPNLGVKYTSAVLRKLFDEDFGHSLRVAKKCAFHTGSGKILGILAEAYKMEREKLEESYEVLKRYGNLAGASLPFILERIVSGNKLSNGDVVLSVGYGWGFSASACLMEYTKLV